VILAVLVAGGVWGVLRQVPERDAAAAGAASGNPDEVKSVAIDGHGLPMSVLRAAVGTRVGAQVDAAQLDRDRAALVAALTSRGYLDARVATPRVSRDGRGAYVTFAVDQGKLFHVRSVAVRGASARDAGVVTLASGDAAIADRIELAREALADRLAARGKKLHVALEVVTDSANAAIDVALVATK